MQGTNNMVEVEKTSFDDHGILESEVWRAVSAQETETNALCSSINDANVQLCRETHLKLDDGLTEAERQELRLRELAVLDEFQRRAREATKAIQVSRLHLEETVQAARDAFAGDLKTSLESAVRAEREEEARAAKSRKSSPGLLRSLMRLSHRLAGVGIAAFLARETISRGRLKSNLESIKIALVRRKASFARGGQDIHTLPNIEIPNCGMRDTVMVGEDFHALL